MRFTASMRRGSTKLRVATHASRRAQRTVVRRSVGVVFCGLHRILRWACVMSVAVQTITPVTLRASAAPSA